MPNEELEMLQDDLKLKWVKVKIKMTNWLNESMTGMDACEDSKAIKCMVDSLAVMEKLIGVDADTPEDLEGGLKTLGKRVKGAKKRMKFEDDS